MKKMIVFSTICILCSTSLKGQGGYHEWVNTPVSNSVVSEVFDLLPFKNHTWLTSGLSSWQFENSCWSDVYIFDSTLKLIRKIHTEITDKIITDKNDHLISMGMPRFGDVRPPYKFLLFVMNENGDTLLRRYFYDRDKAYNEFGENLKGFNLVNDTTYLLCSDSMMLKVSNIGKIQSLHRLKTINSLDYIVPVNSNYFLVVENNKIFSSDSTGSIQLRYIFSHNLTQPANLNDTFYIASGSSIYRLNKSLKIIDSFNLGFLYLENILHIKSTNNYIWICGEGGQLVKKSMVLKLKKDYIITGTWILPDSPVNPVLFFNVNEPYFIIGNNGNFIHMSLYTFNSESFTYPINQLDIQLDSLSIPSYQFDYFKDYDTTLRFWGFYYSADFKVTNNGKGVVNSFYVYISYNHGIQPPVYKIFDKLNLQPGNTVSLSYKGFYSTTNKISFPICFNIMLPNNKNESNILNNTICDTFVVVGLKENTQSIGCRIYPNPVSEFLITEFSGIIPPEGFSFSIFNSLGSLAGSGKIMKNFEKISISLLPAGAYYIRFWNDKKFDGMLFIKK